MLNTQLFNTNLFNTWSYQVFSQTSVISFAGYQFGGAFRLQSLDMIDNTPSIDFNTYTRANADWVWLDSIYYRTKTITVKGILKWNDASDLMMEMTTLKQAMSKRNQDFIYVRSDGEAVKTTGNCTSVSFDRQYFHVSFVPVTLEIVTLEPFFYSLIPNEQVWTSQTGDTSASIQNLSGDTYSYPIIVVSFLIATWVDEISITLWDKTITINEPMADNESLVIDTKQKTILKWSQVIWYTWVFPRLDRWEPTFNVEINGIKQYDVNVLRFGHYA